MVVESFIFLVLNIAAFVGNLLVCMALYRNPALRTITNNFIFSLAITDLLTSATTMPIYSISSLLNRWIVGETASKIFFCSLVTSTETSTLTVMMLAINRYFRVVRPELYGNIYSKKSSALMSIAAWIIGLLVAVSFLAAKLRYENIRSHPTVHQLIFSSRISFIYVTTVSGFLIIIPCLVVAVCYVKIYKTIRFHNTATAPSSQNDNSPYGVQEARITRLLTVVVVGFYLCLFPRYITIILEGLKLLPLGVSRYIVFMRTFPLFTSSVINPIFYGVMNPSFRLEFVKIVFCR